jgi:CheY-like chemotaxis protein
VPVVAAQVLATAPVDAPRPPLTPLLGLRVLALDNEPTILEGMRILLSGWGCDVVVASTLEEALAAVRDGRIPPEAIVADYHLDQGNGLDAIAALRLALKADIPAVLVTADRSPAVRSLAGSMAVHLLNKPLKPAALRALLARWRASRMAAE